MAKSDTDKVIVRVDTDDTWNGFDRLNITNDSTLPRSIKGFPQKRAKVFIQLNELKHRDLKHVEQLGFRKHMETLHARE